MHGDILLWVIGIPLMLKGVPVQIDCFDVNSLAMYDFKIPFSNNRAEVDIRPAKLKLNIGIFRIEVGAKYYLQIRSFIFTFSENNRNVFQEIKNAFDDKVITLKAVQL